MNARPEHRASEADDIVLRAAQPADLEALVAIENRCFSTDRLSRRRLRYYIEASHAVMMVAVQPDAAKGASVTGYALLLLRRGTQLTRLYSVAVLPEARGRGLAEKLIVALEERALAKGKRFMRLEVASNNISAIALYERLGFHRFGLYPDYYDDHSDALRMQKTLVNTGGTCRQPPYPWYQQTTEFTCGPAALMMALSELGHALPMTQHSELTVWRRATTIYMTSGHGGCHPIGLALAAADHGVTAEVWLNAGLPLFVEGVRNKDKKKVLTFVENSFESEAKAQHIPVQQFDWKLDDLINAMDEGAKPVCLISTYAFDRKKAPHWVTVTGYDRHNVYLHDPDADGRPPVECQHLPVAREDFMRLASYGQRKVRALVLLRDRRTSKA
ncbi:GNAT family N-acetyltransferase/peptidase C39 family protein [Alteromonas halophila]|uniref:GNAT family N-acetyltransferase n=1 Tax=Alteromonas halophila TaxID=516698 RepID=A0A918JD19_9ALTE|nr:GNAT family N-acetyltransferase/peptidase C39 family protein [Alteromonas halophila]GGW75086.1 GNAT family N-acetyltransferase [Alteromonas halophila]